MPVAIVRGSSGCIGRGIALQLADDRFDVVLNDIAPKQADNDAVVADMIDITAKGKNAIGVADDVSNKEQVQALVSGTVEKFGALNIMVANAGILETTPLLELSVEQWDWSIAINLRGVFLCMQTSALQFIKQGGGGKITAACSISGYRPSGKAPAYCSSKWGVRGLTQTAVLELGAHGITVNLYCPGSVQTGMSLVFAERLAKERGESNVEEVYKTSKYRTNALGQELFPENIAGLVSFLAGKDSPHMTGQSIICDGGRFTKLLKFQDLS
jgi:meso-butanediol dehydrogenase/(S,S)-butanediol dehydrogenase/diacetyl reductase